MICKFDLINISIEKLSCTSCLKYQRDFEVEIHDFECWLLVVKPFVVQSLSIQDAYSGITELGLPVVS